MTLFPSAFRLAAVAVAVAATLVAVPVAAVTAASDPTPEGAATQADGHEPVRRVVARVRLRSEPGSVVRSGTRGLPPGRVRAALTASSYSMVAFTWQGAVPRLAIRSRSAGRWSSWRPVAPLADGPGRNDPESSRAPARQGSELVWVGPSDGLRVRVAGRGHRNLAVVLIDPGSRPADQLGQLAPPAARAAAPGARTPRPARAPAPRLFSRRQWGANEAWRGAGPWYNATIRQVHVHHTVNANSYDRSDVPALIRGIYRYHTRTLGWSDVGYNFLIDRFGRVWIGRAGGPARRVRGAHTLGFNHNSTGIALIGDFSDTAPSRRARTALVRLAAWKLDKARRQPAGRIWVGSEGSDRFPPGARVRLPVILGHRDTNQTACPGQRLYDALPRVRRRAQARVDYF